MKPLVKTEFAKPDESQVISHYLHINQAEEVWINDLYQVSVRRHVQFGPILMTHLSIKRRDRAPFMDWRHMQWIKNQLVGEENEGCELFPKESRLVDGANQYHIWVFEDKSMGFPFGFFERLVLEKNPFGGEQRQFPENRKPTDLKANEKKLIDLLNKNLDNATDKK